MANYDQERLHQVELGRRADMAIDQGLRSYMLSVYNYMAMALALTGLVALGAYNMAVVETPAGLAFSEFDRRSMRARSNGSSCWRRSVSFSS